MSTTSLACVFVSWDSWDPSDDHFPRMPWKHWSIPSYQVVSIAVTVSFTVPQTLSWEDCNLSSTPQPGCYRTGGTDMFNVSPGAGMLLLASHWMHFTRHFISHNQVIQTACHDSHEVMQYNYGIQWYHEYVMSWILHIIAYHVLIRDTRVIKDDVGSPNFLRWQTNVCDVTELRSFPNQ